MTQDHEISHRTVLIITIEGKAECFNFTERTQYKSVLQRMKLMMHARHLLLLSKTFGSVGAHACNGLRHFLAPMILFLHFLKFNPATQREAERSMFAL